MDNKLIYQIISKMIYLISSILLLQLTLFDNNKKYKKIKDIGAAFNKGIGKDTYRVAIIGKYTIDIQTAKNNLYTNILKECKNKNHLLRLRVKRDKFFFTTKKSEKLFTEIVIICDISDIEHYRKNDKYNIDMPIAYVCLSRYSDKYTYVTWMFRHDLIDGFKYSQTIIPLLYTYAPLIYDRIKLKSKGGTKKKTIKDNCIYFIKALPDTVINLPKTLTPVKHIGKKKYYCHTLSYTDIIKIECKKYNCGINNYINSVFVLAFFKAYPHKKTCHFAINMLSGYNKLAGNSTSISVLIIQRTTVLSKILKSIEKQTHKLLFYLIYKISTVITSNYNILPKIICNWFDKTHRSWDFLASNIPSYDKGAIPSNINTWTIRETDDWLPNIFYGIGTADVYTLDIYWTVTNKFNQVSFENILKIYLKPIELTHNNPINIKYD